MSDHAEVESPSKPRVTIVVTPRERFGMAQKSLESVYETADIPFDLIYVDGGSPRYFSDWLKAVAPVKGFKLIQQDRFVSSNEARNLAVAASTSEYIVFIDNDVICAEGWLSALVKAADETGADVVSPIICEGMPLHTCVHRTTGTFTRDRAEFFAAPHGERLLIDVMTHFKMPLEKVRHELRREETDACEFHCILVRRSILEKTGPFDENIRATKEYIDFSMCVLKAGGKLIFEPGALVTYVYPTSASPITREEMSYFLLRWSPLWQTQDLAHMQRKWGLTDDGELAEVRDIEYMRRRQFEGYIKPWIRKLPLVRRSYKLRKAAGWILRQYVDRKVRGLAREYERQRTAHHRMLGAK
jgi:GT2 family glycosyltransferase